MGKRTKEATFLASITIAAILLGVILGGSIVPQVDQASLTAARVGIGEFSEAFENLSANPDALIVGTSTLTANVSSTLLPLAGHVNYTDEIALPSGMEVGNTIVLIDGWWLQNRSSEPTANAIRTMLKEGLPVLVFAGDLNPFISIADGLNISFVNATRSVETPIAVTGLKLGLLGGPTTVIEVGGSASVTTELDKAVRSSFTFFAGSNDQGPSDRSEGGEPFWNMTLVYSYYSGDLFQPYGRMAVLDQYYRWDNATGTFATNNDYYLVHSHHEVDPGWGVYSNDYRTSDLREQIWFTRISSGENIDYAPYSQDQGRVRINLATPVYSSGIDPSPASWNYSTIFSRISADDSSSLGKQGWTNILAIDSFDASRPATAEPGVEYTCHHGWPAPVRQTYSANWGRAVMFGWEHHDVSVSTSGTLR